MIFPIHQIKNNLMPGEQHIFDTHVVAVSSFHYPNSENLQGINLHTHELCDDVEIIIDGTPGRIAGTNKVKQLFSNTLILNPPRSLHSLIQLDENESTIVSFRFPRDYNGTAYSISDYKNLKKTRPSSKVFHLSELSVGKIYQTIKSYAYLVDKNIFKHKDSDEVFLIALTQKLILKIDSQILSINRGDILRLKNFNGANIYIENGLGVEIGSR